MMLWWHWAVLGLLLAAAELLTPGGFFVIFFGLGGLVVAVLAAMGLAEPLWLQILLFSVFSVASLLLFRNPLLRWMARHTPPADQGGQPGRRIRRGRRGHRAGRHGARGTARRELERQERGRVAHRGRRPLPRHARRRSRDRHST